MCGTTGGAVAKIPVAISMAMAPSPWPEPLKPAEGVVERRVVMAIREGGGSGTQMSRGQVQRVVGFDDHGWGGPWSGNDADDAHPTYILASRRT